MIRSNLLIFAAAAAVGAGGGVMREVHRVHTTPVAGTIAPVVASAPASVQPVHPALAAARAVLGSMGIENGARAAEVQNALTALAGEVREQSAPNALEVAFRAYFNYRAAHPDEVRKPYLYFVDYGLKNSKPRGYVFDMQQLKVVDGPFTVAAGRGSAAGADGVPTRFSNASGSDASSLGLFKAQEVYAFSGHTGGNVYHSVGMRIDGVSGRFNDAARDRRVVVHGAPYVTPSKAGRSEGCPAMEPARARELLPRLSNGGMIFLFSPNDHEWLSQDPWINAVVG